MKLKTFQKVPVEIELDDDDQYELVGTILKNHYNETYDSLDDNDRNCFRRIYRYFTGLSIDYLER